MVDDRSPAHGSQSGGASEGPGSLPERKELDGFKVVRTAPQQSEGGLLGPLILLVILAAGGGFAAYKFGGGDQGPESSAGDSSPPTSGVRQPPPDEEVPDYVWERLDFLEGEGSFEKALEVAEEANKETPNSQLRAKIARYRKELGLDKLDLTFPQALQKAQAAQRSGELEEALEYADVAVDLSPEGDAQAYFLRGRILVLLGKKEEAQEDLEEALDRGYEPAAEVEKLLDQLEGSGE
ncbi:MAG: hypothetical protein D6731_11285 [Planctomycetota bacterium]|nr:MAG: hypothetical protein D6731_11285 [Planctomycetota bacterium]